ncbi:ankyrin repeat domain-containing protein, partial [Gammaproteobacteria bacterium]|nr:ankyrin repeat domain-containing protein [Gammaproteobacteria bacterium]
IVERLLYCRSVVDNATAQDNYALRSAASNGYDDIFRDLIFLHNVQYEAAALDNDALRSAASNGHIDIVQRLLGVPEVEAHARSMMEKLYLSVVEGEIKDVQTCLPHISYLAPVIHHLPKGLFPNGFLQIKTLAAMTKKWEIFNLLETHLRDHFSICSAGNVNFLLLQAVKSNQQGAVQRILAKGGGANIISMMEHRVCIEAWENKNTDIFEMLLASLDAYSMNSLLCEFILRGDINAVDRLLQLDFSASSIVIANGILLSVEQNDLKMLDKMLDKMLKHPADMPDQNILEFALASCSLEGLAKLLEHEAIARPTDINDVLLAAISRDNPDILARLLDLPAINQNLAAFFSDEILKKLKGKANPNMIFNIAKVHFPDGVKGNASISQKWKTLIREGYKEDHGVEIAEQVMTARLSRNPESLSLSSLPPVVGGTAGLIATFTHRGSSRPLPPKDDTPLPDDVTKEAKGSPKTR